MHSQYFRLEKAYSRHFRLHDCSTSGNERCGRSLLKHTFGDIVRIIKLEVSELGEKSDSVRLKGRVDALHVPLFSRPTRRSRRCTQVSMRASCREHMLSGLRSRRLGQECFFVCIPREKYQSSPCIPKVAPFHAGYGIRPQSPVVYSVDVTHTQPSFCN